MAEPFVRATNAMIAGDFEALAGLCDAKGETNETVLHVAAFLGLLDSIDFFLKRGVDPKAVTSIGETAFYIACEQGLQESAKKLLEADRSVLNLCEVNGYSPLYAAVMYADGVFVDWLLSLHDVDWKRKYESEHSEDGEELLALTLLHVAAQRGCLEVLEVVLRHCPSLVAKMTLDGLNALHIACMEGHVDLIPLLANAESLKASLHIGALTGNVNVVRALLRNGAGAIVNVVNEVHSVPPIVYAARNSHNDVMTVLVEEADATCDSAFLECLSKGNATGAQYLYSKVKDASTKRLGLFKACRHGSNLKFLQWLQGKGIDFNVRDGDGWTPLMYACASGSLQLVRWLCEHADTTMRVDMHTILSVAARAGHAEVVRHLVLVAKVKVDERVVSGKTALHIACKKGHVETVKVLIKACGANVNAMRNNNGTPLHLACSNGHVDVIRYLIRETDADILGFQQICEGPVMEYATPFATAVARNHFKAAQLLLVYVLAALDPMRKLNQVELSNRLYGSREWFSSEQMRELDDVYVDSKLTPLQIALKCNMWEDAHFLIVQGFVHPRHVLEGDSPARMIAQGDDEWLLRLRDCVLPWAPSRSLTCFSEAFYKGAVKPIMALAMRDEFLPMELWFLVLSLTPSSWYTEPFMFTRPDGSVRVSFLKSYDAYKRQLYAVLSA